MHFADNVTIPVSGGERMADNGSIYRDREGIVVPSNRMRRIAFLSYDWDYEVMSAYYQGAQALFEATDDAQLVIFNAYGTYADLSPQPEALGIFSLCKLEDYDGFIIQGNRVWPPLLRQQMACRMIELGKPVVSVNYELPGTCMVGTDNYQAMYGLVDLILTERSCTRPAFVNGLATSVEAAARARAYRDVCAAHGLADSRFYQADWQSESGRETALIMLEHPDDLPDVVFCCNDDIAVGVQETLQEHGVKVPEEVMVTGFDKRENSSRAVPRITTVDRDFCGIGYTAAQTVLKMVDGQSVGPFVASGAKYVLRPSCGYDSDVEITDDVANSLYVMDYALKRFYELLTILQPAVLTASSLAEVLDVCETCFCEVRLPHVYLSLNDDYLKREGSGFDVAYGETSALVACFERPDLSHDANHVYARFASKSLLPPECSMDKPTYMVFPLRQGGDCIGTFVTEGVSPVMQYGFLTFILTLLSSGIEVVRNKALLKMVNERLDNLYVHDQLTGLFNRFGLERYGAAAYKQLLNSYGSAFIIFVDLDDMKGINDRYGHEQGDLALCDTANIIRRAAGGEDAFAMRYGGDEFLVIARCDLSEKLIWELKGFKARVTRPFDLCLSLGVYEVSQADCQSVSEAIAQADARMYEVKRRRKG